MILQRVGVSLFTLIAIVSILLAAATIWLFVTNPVTVATAVNEGDISPLIRNLAQVVYNALNPSAGGAMPKGAPGQDYGRLLEKAKQHYAQRPAEGELKPS